MRIIHTRAIHNNNDMLLYLNHTTSMKLLMLANPLAMRLDVWIMEFRFSWKALFVREFNYGSFHPPFPSLMNVIFFHLHPVLW